MKALCVSCGYASEETYGYCGQCGDVRLIEEAVPGRDVLAPQPEPMPLRFSRAPGLEGIVLKLELTNPTGSFKDRVMRVLVEQAMNQGARGAIVASSGNAAIAAAAACAKVGLPLLVLVPHRTPRDRIQSAERRGATVVRAGEDPSEVHRRAASLAEAFHLANLASTFASPGCEWACRQIGREVAEQHPGVITDVVAPVSCGPVLIGTGRGILERRDYLPRLVATQASGCAPIARAFAQGRSQVVPWDEEVTTKALSIADRLRGYPQDGSFTLSTVRESGGFAAAATDDELRQMSLDLARFDGLEVELASCAAPAVWRREMPGRSDGVVCVITGNGTREPISNELEVPSTTMEDYAARTGSGAALVAEVSAWTRV